MQLTVFVLAAESGYKQERWAKHMAMPKQMVEVKGETLIGRVLRLCRLHSEGRVHLVTRHDHFDALPVIKLVPACFATKAHSVLSVLDVWRGGQLVLLYSDVYYSNAAFSRIMTTSGTHFFGRGGRSAFTFKDYGELFAVRVAWEDKEYFTSMLRGCVENYERNGQQSFWALYRMMAGFPVDVHKVENSLFVDIHDETDDIDFPKDVQLVIEAVEKRLRWRARFLVRCVSLWNKQRRDRWRGNKKVSKRTQVVSALK